MATFLVVALAVPPLLLLYFMGQQIAQVWAMAATLCFYVFFLIFLCVRWNRQDYADFISLSYSLLLVLLAAGMIGPPRTAVFVLHLITVWATGYLGYSLAVYRLPKGTERTINALPSRPYQYHSKGTAEELPHWISIGGFVEEVLSTALMAASLYGQRIRPMEIVFVFLHMGWIEAVLCAACVAGGFMHERLLLPAVADGELLSSLLVPCVIASPFIGPLSAVLSVLFQWLLLMALVAFLGYNLAVCIHYRHTAAAPRRMKRHTEE